MEQDYQGIYIRIKPGSPRAARFQQVFGRLERIPVVFAETDGIYDEAGKRRDAYILSTARLTNGELNNLAIYYADLMRVLPDEARRLIKDSIIPIYSDDCEIEERA